MREAQTGGESMYCTECGTRNDDTAKFCIKCGAQLQALLVEPSVRKTPTSPSTPPVHKPPIRTRRHTAWGPIALISALVILLVAGVVGGPAIYQNLKRTDTQINQTAEIDEEEAKTSVPGPAIGNVFSATVSEIGGEEAKTSEPHAPLTPTPDYSNLSLGQVAVTDKWALSVYSVLGKRQPSIVGNDFMRYSIGYAIKNVSSQVQYYTLSALPMELLDRDGYNVQSGRNTMFSPELPIFIPSGLVIQDGVVLDVTSFPVEPLQVVIPPDFAGNRMVFSGSVGAESSLVSEEESVNTGEVVTFGSLKLELLAGDHGAEVAFHNESDQEMRIEWKDTIWLDLRPSFYPDAQVMVAFFLTEQGRLCVAQASNAFPSQIGAGMKARGRVAPACGGNFGQIDRMLIFDASGRTVVFELNKE